MQRARGREDEGKEEGEGGVGDERKLQFFSGNKHQAHEMLRGKKGQKGEPLPQAKNKSIWYET